jgi:hypothetical protein
MKMVVHLGFMAEEISVKLKKTLEKCNSTSEPFEKRSVLIITRDLIDSKQLFEQPYSRYLGLQEAITAGNHSTTFVEPADRVANNPKMLVKKMEEFLGFLVETYRMDSLKKKLANGKPKITVIQVGIGRVSDIYMQFSEMGFQATLAVKLVKGMMSGLFAWIDEKISKKGESTNIFFNVFGAGGSLQEDCPPGTMNEVHSTFGIRRLLKPASVFRGKCSLRFFSSPQSFS